MGIERPQKETSKENGVRVVMDTLAAPRWGESTLKNSVGKGGRAPTVGTTKCPVSVVEKRSDTLAALKSSGGVKHTHN